MMRLVLSPGTDDCLEHHQLAVDHYALPAGSQRQSGVSFDQISHEECAPFTLIFSGAAGRTCCLAMLL